jgi:hypothetical protein
MEEEVRYTKVYLDEAMNVSSAALTRARAKGIPSDLRAYLLERRASVAIDCSRASGIEELRHSQGRIAEITALLGLFQSME